MCASLKPEAHTWISEDLPPKNRTRWAFWRRRLERGDIIFTPASFLLIHRTTASGVPERPLLLPGGKDGPITERRSDPLLPLEGDRA